MTTINDLPDCVLEQLLRHPALHHRDVRAAGQTCRRLRALCGPIWRRGRAAEIRQTWDEEHAPALAELRLAAALAAQGELTELQFLHLDDLDTSAVPPGELGALVRCVRGCVILSSVRGDLAPVLANIDCDELIIPNGTLGTEE